MGMVDGHGALEKGGDSVLEGQGVQRVLVDGHGALEKEEDSGWRVRASKWGWSLDIGPLNSTKSLVGRARAFKGGMVDGHGALEKEEDSGLEGQGV